MKENGRGERRRSKVVGSGGGEGAEGLTEIEGSQTGWRLGASSWLQLLNEILP